MRIVFVTPLGVCLCAFISTLCAQNSEYNTVSVGDKAPPITVQEWLKGSPLTGSDGIYVVEFSGTWCAPCVKAIPHLTELQRRFKGRIKIVSVFVMENDRKDTSNLNYLENVRALITSLGEKMDYTIGVDVPQQTCLDTWKPGGVPNAFVVDEFGTIIWEGHPSHLSEILEEITSGFFDPKTASQRQRAFEDCKDAIIDRKARGDYAEALQGIDSLINVYPNDNWLLFLKFRILAGYDVKKAYDFVEWLVDKGVQTFEWPHFIGGEFDHSIPIEKRNYSIELKAIDRTIELSETDYLKAHPFFLKAQTFAAMEDYDNAIESCKKAIESAKKHPNPKPKVFNRYEAKIVEFRYKKLASVNQMEAANWLRSVIKSGQSLEFFELLNGVLSLKRPDYSLALEIVNALLEHGTADKALCLGKKSTIYAEMGDFKNAIEFGEQAKKEYVKRNLERKVKEFEDRIIQYKKARG